MNNITTYLILVLILTYSCTKNSSDKFVKHNEIIIDESKPNKQKQEEIINEHLKNGAWKYELYSREWQEEIDKGLAKDSTIAYLWQQKAMPLFKQGKHEVGLKYIDNAVKYNPQKWQDYRAFIKCIFVKDYSGAIADFKDYKEKFGYGYVMDHTYDFYIGLSYLQLNEFKKAEQIFQEDYKRQLEEHGTDRGTRH